MSGKKAAPAVIIIFLMFLLITVLYLFAGATVGGVPLWSLHQRLYYIPVGYAAYLFGRRGGIVAVVVACAIVVLHSWLPVGESAVLGFDTWLEVGSLIAVGAILGTMRDTEQTKNADLKRMSLQLEGAYKKLEDRAIQLINIQDYTQSILRSITSAVLTVGPDGSVATANAAAERMLGVSEFEMVPKPIGSLFRSDGGLGGDVAKVLAGRLPLAMRETTIQTVGGRMLHVQASTSCMRDVDGDNLGAVITLEDVSDVKALTDQLIRADRLAALGQLTAGVAHEVRNPLGVIRASVQLLEDAHGDAARIKEIAGVIKQEIDRLNRVIKALLDFGRPSTPTLVRTDLRETIAHIVSFASRFALQSGVRIVQKVPEDLPAVSGDPDQLEQVFLNLVTNAVQAMGDIGGIITIEARSDEYFVEVSVADTGPGIDPADLAKIFDPFFTKRADGTGLGLTVVHRIIEDHDGQVEVESGPGGTVFTIRLHVASTD
ncbi:MAG: PAS domain-containing protein [Coriobacteriia bacterium]|nr:PAS domain-containing protein [Coriobacteriia bacterium]